MIYAWCSDNSNNDNNIINYLRTIGPRHKSDRERRLGASRYPKSDGRSPRQPEKGRYQVQWKKFSLPLCLQHQNHISGKPASSHTCLRLARARNAIAVGVGVIFPQICHLNFLIASAQQNAIDSVVYTAMLISSYVFPTEYKNGSEWDLSRVSWY